MSAAGYAARSKAAIAATVVVLLAGLAAAAGLQAAIDRRMAAYSDTPDLLWIPSGKIMKRLSLGHDGLLADVYWTRVVQYYGGRLRDRNPDFSLLPPLLDVTVELDPYLLVAYKFGAIFLSDNPPRGAGQPLLAVNLIRKGIQANPEEWRLWHDLGFIYYWNLKDYGAASAAYLEGAKNPHAAAWMKVMAAVIAQKGGNRETSRFLWSEVLRSTEDELIKNNAREHLAGLKALDDMDELEKLVSAYRDKTGQPPRALSDLTAAGLLRGVPADPQGNPYQIGADGKVGLSPKSKVRLD